ncbi:bifunctional 3,4-dihydroxy-2-butanone-4-phosphate synthase/GTP cyclohydrolase II [uncultured Idiomarina sp.]|uniref:bifunctional 3,4-dihydroxy-2-butanone-4-phosphate synthase/GTP cyclohydrolase II n=1 Tax=uncultured Idiomarina sp. TaxID=352961 RepID=UPI002599AB71|nr:bifunctional 3,4-dihydroxy-2-butanone-4-phosphate synthase/GTP cyclohydrolase II [uncultured Idiomarina sp.]
MKLNSTEEIIKDIATGKMVIIMDDENRENEGDLMIAAEHVTAEAVNFMARYGRGLICQTMTEERCKQLNLPLMVRENGAQFSTNFTVSIEAAEGVSTGISAADRACTVQAAIAKDAKPSDIVQPGHIFPIKARAGGVLTRAGHTEAGCDFARLAGLEPSSVIVEILNEDGTMARRPDLEKFAKEHKLKIGTIADLIEYRNLNESIIKRIAKRRLPTQYGDFDLLTYKDSISENLHYALTKGDIDRDKPALVRVHVHNAFADLLQFDCSASKSWSFPSAMEKIAKEGGILAIISSNEFSGSLVTTVQRFENASTLVDYKEQNIRNIGLGSQILSDLGVESIRLMSVPKKYPALSGFGLKITEFVGTTGA